MTEYVRDLAHTEKQKLTGPVYMYLHVCQTRKLAEGWEGGKVVASIIYGNNIYNNWITA